MKYSRFTMLCQLLLYSEVTLLYTHIYILFYVFFSIMVYLQLSLSIVSDSLRPHGLQYTRLPYPSPTPRAYSNSCPCVGDAIQPSHSLSSPSPPAPSPSQHQGLFQWVSSSNQVAKELEFQLQHRSFQWIFRTDFH